MPRRTTTLTADQAKELVESYQAGATIHELAARFGIAHRTVTRVLRDHDVTVRRRSMSPSQVDEAVRLYDAGLSLAQIGDRIGVNATTVHKRLKERGVQTRRPGRHAGSA